MDYHKAKRRTKLFQIENALNGNSENVFMSMGLNMSNVEAMSQFSGQKAKGDKSFDKLMETIAQRSQYVSPSLA